MKTIKHVILSFALCLSACSTSTINSNINTESAANQFIEANPEHRMAHNVYSNPDLSQFSNNYSGFLIDFKTTDQANGTYWALCNWSMNIDSLKSKYSNAYTDGAYAGLQIVNGIPKGITSFWDTFYTDNAKQETIHAKVIYPTTQQRRFDNEGEGMSYISDYPWKSNTWYRMYLNCYDDNTGKTFVETWFEDIEKEEWTLFCTYDTGLYHSCFQGTMSQFMENFDYQYADQTRSFMIKNLYVREANTNNWNAITRSKLSIDTWWDNKKGGADFGVKDNTLTGTSNGIGKDQFELNADISSYYTITPDYDPTLPD